MWLIFRLIFGDVVRNRTVVAYSLLLFAVSTLFLGFSPSEAKALAGLQNVVFSVVPLTNLVFGVAYLYDSREFVTLLAAQPIGRANLYLGRLAALSLAMTSAYAVGVGVPLILWTRSEAAMTLFGVGELMSLVFVALSFRIHSWIRDKSMGMGAGLMFWLFFTFVYDALVLQSVFIFREYPFEKPLLILVFLNPVDLARTLVLLKLENAALLGLTGALFKEFLDDSLGWLVAVGMMLVQAAVPAFWAGKRFLKADL